MTYRTYSSFGEYIADPGIRQEEIEIFMKELHPDGTESALFDTGKAELPALDHTDAMVSAAGVKDAGLPLSEDNISYIYGIMLISYIDAGNEAETEEICSRIRDCAEIIFDGANPGTKTCLPKPSMTVRTGDSFMKFYRYSTPLSGDDDKGIRLHKLLSLRMVNSFNNLFKDLKISAKEELSGDGLTGMCRMPGYLNSENDKYSTIHSINDVDNSQKALCVYFGIDPNIADEEINEAISREKDNPEYIEGLFYIEKVSGNSDKEYQDDDTVEKEVDEGKEENKEADKTLWENRSFGIPKPERDLLIGRINSLHKLAENSKNLEKIWCKMQFIMITAYVRLYGINDAACLAEDDFKMLSFAINDPEKEKPYHEELERAIKYHRTYEYAENGRIKFFDGTWLPKNAVDHWKNDTLIKYLGITDEEEVFIGLNESKRNKKQRKENVEEKKKLYSEIAKMWLSGVNNKSKIARCLGVTEGTIRTAIRKMGIENRDKALDQINFNSILYNSDRYGTGKKRWQITRKRAAEKKFVKSYCKTYSEGEQVCISTCEPSDMYYKKEKQDHNKETQLYKEETQLVGDIIPRYDNSVSRNKSLHSENNNFECDDNDALLLNKGKLNLNKDTLFLNKDGSILNKDEYGRRNILSYGDKNDEYIKDDIDSKLIEDYLTKDRLLVLGSSGTGKTYVLKKLASLNKKCLIIAPTGKASENTGMGITIHKAFNLKAHVMTKDYIMDNLHSGYLSNIDVLFLDEVSMLRIDMFTYIVTVVEKAERVFHKKIKIVFFGDFLQLPPVIKSPERSVLKKDYPEIKNGYAFESPDFKRWFNTDNTHVLTAVHRTDDPDLIEKSHQIGYGDKTAAEWYNSHISHEELPDALYIASTNKVVNEINSRKVKELLDTGVQSKVYKVTKGESNAYEEKALAVGMRIICTRNKSHYKNGSMGTIVSLNKKGISVMLDNGNRVVITQNEGYGLPVNIAYALTVHRVQGMTLDRVNIVADGFFEAGQAYVALTRCTSREGMRIIGEIKPEDIKVNDEAVAWMQDNVPVIEEEEDLDR